ncbi:MAG TPA: hypothetical protein PLY34_13175 [Ferruginibacter sp.]|nr:hypothetical protein [Ferruginibacter sp.]HPH91993.1 hypothetical protein [Ferruginibacter sp.]
MKSKDMRVFFVYLSVLAVFSILLLILRELGYKNTYGLQLQTIYPAFETCLVSWFFYKILKSKYVGLVLSTGSILLTILFISYLFQTKDKLPFLPLALEEIFFLVVILFSLYEKIKFFSEMPLYRIPSFWISLGFLIYFSGTLFLYLFSISVTNKDTLFIKQYNVVVMCFLIIKDILLCIAIYTNKMNQIEKKKTSRSETFMLDYDELPKILSHRKQ